jgi:hypothetical protein
MAERAAIVKDLSFRTGAGVEVNFLHLDAGQDVAAFRAFTLIDHGDGANGNTAPDRFNRVEYLNLGVLGAGLIPVREGARISTTRRCLGSGHGFRSVIAKPTGRRPVPLS